MSIIKRLDNGLAAYYASAGLPYFNNDGIGKFVDYCEGTSLYQTAAI